MSEASEARNGDQERDPFAGETPNNDLPDREKASKGEQPKNPGVAGTPDDWEGGADTEREGGVAETSATPGGLDGPSTGQGGG